ncbi:hypothetical protein ASPCAL11566 [Aspergillus calidoustus]|uniref:Uncharacterized protein n=1 Tax=Aspergillus calidoustus TaxID=454130 RepID=A0A0U5G9I2_ASPCI|nr:hypothetical protein ASPCAL11566 [Aspergillus calidoustus]
MAITTNNREQCMASSRKANLQRKVEDPQWYLETNHRDPVRGSQEQGRAVIYQFLKDSLSETVYQTCTEISALFEPVTTHVVGRHLTDGNGPMNTATLKATFSDGLEPITQDDCGCDVIIAHKARQLFIGSSFKVIADEPLIVQAPLGNIQQLSDESATPYLLIRETETP